MRIEKLDLTHKDLLYNRLKDIDISISEYSFPNLYLFRQNHNYEVIFDQEIFISGITYDGVRYIMPTSDIRKMDIEYVKKIITEFKVLFPIPEEWLKIFDQNDFSFNYNDGDTDYIHTTAKLGSYSGKKLHSKRNLLKQFLDQYKYEVFPLTQGRIDDAIHILEEWQRDMDIPLEETDFYPCLEALKLYEDLNLCGGIYYVESDPAGFILGEELSDKFFALHFAKGKKKYKGFYQFMFNNFAKIIPAKYCCLNFEQDLGKESLRQAKASYKPEFMIKKYRVSLK